jgi:orotate phosphoribosyltransferase-like protein
MIVDHPPHHSQPNARTGILIDWEPLENRKTRLRYFSKLMLLLLKIRKRPVHTVAGNGSAGQG